MWKLLNDHAISEFGDFEAAKFVLLDCEAAAHKAVESVFGERGWSVRSCHFHFVKNILDRAKSTDLIEENARGEMKDWINAIIGKILYY